MVKNRVNNRKGQGRALAEYTHPVYCSLAFQEPTQLYFLTLEIWSKKQDKNQGSKPTMTELLKMLSNVYAKSSDNFLTHKYGLQSY